VTEYPACVPALRLMSGSQRLCRHAQAWQAVDLAKRAHALHNQHIGIIAVMPRRHNGDFEEYWRFHLAREHQRLYPGTKQRQYSLGA
jgi:hypothetical protein